MTSPFPTLALERDRSIGELISDTKIDRISASKKDPLVDTGITPIDDSFFAVGPVTEVDGMRIETHDGWH